MRRGETSQVDESSFEIRQIHNGDRWRLQPSAGLSGIHHQRGATPFHESIVRVTEQQALARWGKTALVNMRGELFEPQMDESLKRLPLLRGPRETNRMVAEQYVAMQGMLKPLGLTITHLSLNERRALSMRLDNGLKLGLGRQDTDLRLLRFVRVYPQVLEPRLATIDSIDLRYTNGFAVRWRAGHEPASV